MSSLQSLKYQEKMTLISEDEEVPSPSPYHRLARYGGSPAHKGEEDEVI